MSEAEMKAMILATLNQGLQVPFGDAEKWSQIKEWLNDASEKGSKQESNLREHPSREKSG